MRIRLFIFIIGSFFVVQNEVYSQVVVCSTIHNAHDDNPNYSYDDLFDFVKKYDPEIIGVEIRQEDMDSSVAYLEHNYPYEMYRTIKMFPDKEVVGFDWLGEDLEGRAVPLNHWKEVSQLKKIERELSKDSIFLQKLNKADSIQKLKLDIFLNEDVFGLNDGRYDRINMAYYQELEKVFKDTKYQVLTDFYKRRNDKIALNICEIIQKNPDKKILFLTGADHRSYVIKAIKEKFGQSVRLETDIEHLVQ